MGHFRPVIGEDREKADELFDLLFRACAHVGIQTAAIIRNLFQGAVQGKVKNIDLFLHDFAVDFPGALYAESGLEIGLRAFQIAQHEDS